MKAVKIFMIASFVMWIFAAYAFAAESSLPNIKSDAGTTVIIPVNINDSTGISGFQYTITFPVDPVILTCSKVLKGELLTDAEENDFQSWTLAYNAAIPGEIRFIGLESNAQELTGPGGGTIAKIECTASSIPGAAISLHFNFAKIVDSHAVVIPLTTVDGVYTINCNPNTQEMCDGWDNNCNSQVDEDIATTCGVGACQATGSSKCENGQMVETCIPGTPQTEGPSGSPSCSDMVDNDCDGSVDGADLDCPQECVPSQEVCDGGDNNCNAQIDEDIASVPTSCGAGVCAASGQAICQNGSIIDTCTPGIGSIETCNNVDDDCDSAVDEDIASNVTACGVGACSAFGTTACQNGQMVDICTPGTPQTEGPTGSPTCSDMVDNDCDGSVDGADSDCPEACNPLQEVCNNIPPAKPNLIEPLNGASGMTTSLTLKWARSTDADGDTVTYKLYIGQDTVFAGVDPIIVAFAAENNNPIMALVYSIGMMGFLGIITISGSASKRKKMGLIMLSLLMMTGVMLTSCGSNTASSNKASSNNSSYESYTINNLQPSTTYYWKVAAADGKGGITESEVYSFTTGQ